MSNKDPPSPPNFPAVQKDKEEEQQEEHEPLPLDWTKLGEQGDHHDLPIRFPSDVYEISKSPEETDLCIVGTAGQKITRIGNNFWKECSPNLTSLVLRSHLITKMEGLSGFEYLTTLELYDNAVEKLEDLNSSEGGFPGKTLLIMDMSYNSIRDMSPVSFCPNLVELYLAQNKLKTMAGLSQLKKLRKLDLGANRLRVMEEDELSGLENLEELWLGKNKITEIGGLDKLTKLRRLDLQANRLTVVENLTAQKDTLEELYLSHNNIGNRGASQPTGLALNFTKLTTLDLSRNRIANTTIFAHLVHLEDLWLSGNKIMTFEDVATLSVNHWEKEEGNDCEFRKGCPQLETLYLEYNPVADDSDYRRKLSEMIPSLTQIDANMISTSAFAYPIDQSGSGYLDDLETSMREKQATAIELAKSQMMKKSSEDD